VPIFKRRGKGPEEPTTRIYFATDIHGSDRCFRKFLNAAEFYGAQVLILGGDITGKTLVPIQETSDGYTARFNANRYEGLDEAGLDELKQRIGDAGQYPIVGTRDELEELHDEAERDEVFKRVVVEGMERWVRLAEERLRGKGVRLLVAPGNDDFLEIDAPLQSSDVVEFAEGKCIWIDDEHEAIVTGYSNRTPWDSPRELDEQDMHAYLEKLFVEVTNPTNLIAVIHPPPIDTDLDKAPEIDEQFRIKMETGQPKLISVGSSAVRTFIEEHQPLLGLHGHVHDSKGSVLIGRTLCINPGSEYTEGTLCGALVAIAGDRVVSHQLVIG
jgi:uncharacterized protein